MAIARIILGWHKLFTGGDGSITNGLTVEALEHDPSSGRMKTWDINDATFTESPTLMQERLGLTSEEYSRYLASLYFIKEKQWRAQQQQQPLHVIKL